MTTKPKNVTIRAKANWMGGVRTDAHIRNFDPIILDEPENLGGTDLGPNPMEYVLAALMGCETVILKIVAEERGFQFEDVQYDIAGTLDLRGLEGVDGVRPYFTVIRGKVEVKTDEDQATLDEIVKEVERRCPVYQTLAAADVAFEVEWLAV